MTDDEQPSAATAIELRQSFDQTFEREPHRADERFVDILAIRVAGARYALRLSQLSGLHVDRRIVPLASPILELLGMAGFRGNIVPVYSLPMLLGYSAVESSRWLALFGKDEMVGLAFDSFDGHLRIPEERVAGGQAVECTSRHVHEVTEIEGTIRPIIDLISLYEGIKKCASLSMSGRSE